MHLRTHVLLGAAVAAALAGCGGPRAFTQGTYEDPSTIELLSDQFNENDLQLIAKKMVHSLDGSPFAKTLRAKPLLVVGKLRNRTTEHIDMSSLADKIRVQLQQTGRFSFVDKAARDEIAEEYEYQQSGAVRPDQAKGPGEQLGADYLMTGAIASIVQEVGGDKLVYYKMTMQLTNLRSGVIEWTDEKELRKKLRKRSVDW
jgi:penicillin-binding protein activator